jgi:hypothetical protein
LLVALVFAWGVKQAVIEPIAMTSLMFVFFKVTEGQTPNAEWEARLDKVSGKFSSLKDKAKTWGTDQPVADEPAQHHLPGDGLDSGNRETSAGRP